MNLFLTIFSVFLYSTLCIDYKPDSGAFQYQNSFNGPFGGTHIPFWETSGSALVMDSYIRLTPNQRSQRGAIWSTRPLRAKDWEILVRFSIGSDSRLGADGMALWYTKDRSVQGPIMGGPDKWSGIAVIIDSFDNDGQRDNPQIYAVYNDNWFTFNSQDDGKMNGLGICSANIRQISKNPETKYVKMVVRLKDKVLTVLYDNSDITGAENSWVECLSATVPFPDDAGSSYYLGLTAETGGLSDFHDVKSVTTWSLRTLDLKNEKEDVKRDANSNPPPETRTPPSTVPDTPRPPKPYITPEKLQESTATEIVSRLSDLEKKDEAFAVIIDAKFKEMQQKT